jgi:uncharacterized membrane protein YhaH (DUF805 family)
MKMPTLKLNGKLGRGAYAVRLGIFILLLIYLFFFVALGAGFGRADFSGFWPNLLGLVVAVVGLISCIGTILFLLSIVCRRLNDAMLPKILAILIFIPGLSIILLLSLMIVKQRQNSA